MQIKKFDSINVVPFIDVMLVLLVIVLTTASFVSKGIIPVDLSKAKSSTKIKKVQEITLSIKKDGELFFNKEKIEINELSNKLLKYKKDIPIGINCDKEAKFDNFVKVIDILKDNSYTNLGVITKR